MTCFPVPPAQKDLVGDEEHIVFVTLFKVRFAEPENCIVY